eukprot:2840807-Ditylum_brightwellii.AAC.1
MEVWLPPPPFDACAFGGDKGGNTEGDVHWEVITQNELPPPFTGCHRFSCWVTYKKVIQLSILLVPMVKMGVVPVGLKPCCSRHQVMRGKFLGNGANMGIAVKMRTEGADNLLMGMR